MSEFKSIKNTKLDVLNFPKQLADQLHLFDLNLVYANFSSNDLYCAFWNPQRLLFFDWKNCHCLCNYTGIEITNCWIADNGTLLIEDSLDLSLSGKIILVDAQGNIFFTRSYKANILNTGLSADGKYAAVQLLRSNNAQSNQLYVYDVSTKKRFIIKKGYLSSDTYAFSEGKLLLDFNSIKAIYDISTGECVQELK